MALLFLDSFDHYSTLADKSWTVAGGDTQPAIAAEGRTASCVKWAVSGSGSPASITFAPTRASSTASGGCGCALKVAGLARITNGLFFSPTQSGEHGLVVRLNTDGTFSLLIYNGISATVLATSSGGITDDVWAYVEFKWLINDSGTFAIVINGNSVMDFSGDTLSSQVALSTWESIRFLSAVNPANGATSKFTVSDSATIRIDDLYLLDLEGSYNTDLLGDLTVEALLPQTDATAPGSRQEWTCGTGSPEDHGEEVNDATPDDDTSYIYSSAPAIDTFNYPALSVSAATIYGVQVSTSANKADSGTAEFRNLVDLTPGSPSSEHQGAATHTPADTGYVYYRDVWEVNPDDDSVWTVGDINGAEFGVERTA